MSARTMMESDSDVDIEYVDDLEDGDHATDAVKIFSKVVSIKHQTVNQELGIIKKEMTDDDDSEGEMIFCLKDDDDDDDINMADLKVMADVKMADEIKMADDIKMDDNVKMDDAKDEDVLFKIVDVRTLNDDDLEERCEEDDVEESKYEVDHDEQQYEDSDDCSQREQIVFEELKDAPFPVPETSKTVQVEAACNEASETETADAQPDRLRYSKYPERRRKKRLREDAVSAKELWLELRRGSARNTKTTSSKKKQGPAKEGTPTVAELLRELRQDPTEPKNISPKKKVGVPKKVNQLGPLSAHNVDKVKALTNGVQHKSPVKSGVQFVNVEDSSQLPRPVSPVEPADDAGEISPDDSFVNRAATHNHLERERRKTMSVLCTRLRQSIPELVDCRNVSKIRVLHTAKRYCEDLAEQAERMECQITMYRLKRNQLVRKFQALKATCTKKQLRSLYPEGS